MTLWENAAVTTGSCGINGCSTVGPLVRGMCAQHYQRWWRTGSPILRIRAAEMRFWARVDPNGEPPAGRPELGPCWIWKGTLQNGYGTLFNDNRKRTYAHRFAYELLVGPIPEGLTIDHLCENKVCVNPSHMEPVTRWENVRRGGNIEKAHAAFQCRTHCKHGHEFTPENTHIQTTNGVRICITCRRAKGRRQAAALSAKRALAREQKRAARVGVPH